MDSRNASGASRQQPRCVALRQHELAEPLQRTLFVAGLQALGKGQYEQAVDKFREAGKAGLREKSLGSLIHYALVKAGQQLLDEKDAG